VPPYFLLSSSAVWIYMILIVAIALFLMFWRQNRLRLMYKESQGLQSSKDSQESMNTKDSQATAAPQSQQESTTPTEDFTDAYEIIDD
jgi:cytoskeletal protein RodZ